MDEIIYELNKIRISAIFLHSSFASPNIGEIVVAQAEIDYLIDSFQSKYADYVTADEIEAARQDVEIFIKLIDSTAKRCMMKSTGQTG